MTTTEVARYFCVVDTSVANWANAGKLRERVRTFGGHTDIPNIYSGHAKLECTFSKKRGKKFNKVYFFTVIPEDSSHQLQKKIPISILVSYFYLSAFTNLIYSLLVFN